MLGNAEREALDLLAKDKPPHFIRFGWIYREIGNAWEPVRWLNQITIERLSRAGLIKSGRRAGPAGSIPVLEISPKGKSNEYRR